MQSNTREKAEQELREREDALRQSGQKIVGDLQEADPAPLDVAGLMDRAEVKQAIAQAVAEQVSGLLTQLEAKRAEAGTGTTALGDRAFVEALALSINELVDQGKPGAKRSVAPAVLAQRKLAHQKMMAAVLKARAQGALPTYDLKGEVYLDEQRIMPVYVDRFHVRRTQRIGWPGVPNLAMLPANEAAREIHGHFLDSIGHRTEAKADPLVSGLVVHGREEMPKETPEVRVGGASFGVELMGRDTPGERVEPPVHVLGHVAPAFQPNS